MISKIIIGVICFVIGIFIGLIITILAVSSDNRDISYCDYCGNNINAEGDVMDSESTKGADI